jgi:hypothetical protein
MAKIESTYLCDICGRSFPSGSNVRGSVAVYDPLGSFLLSDVCDQCTGKVTQALIERFPKLNPRILKHQPTLPEPVSRSSQQ